MEQMRTAADHSRYVKEGGISGRDMMMFGKSK